MKPYFTDESVTLYAGDCLDVLRELPDTSVHAVVTDPPYNLSDSGKRDQECLRRILAEVRLPEFADLDTEDAERGEFPPPALGGATLGWIDWSVRVDAGVGVPESAVHLQDAAIVQQKVDHGDKPAVIPSDADLPAVPHSEESQFLRHFILQAAYAGDAAFCNGTCSCFTEPSAGVIAVPVAFPGSSGGDLPSYLFGGRWPRDSMVRTGYDAGGIAQSSPGVMTGPRAIARAVLRLDLRRRTGELLPTSGAGDDHPAFLLLPAQPIGASARTRGLAAVGESALVRVVDDTADRTFALDLPWHKINASKTTGGFMGKAWDGWESPASFQRWCAAWATECLRVLKPGGHLLAFGGTRTWHRLAVAIEDAGFEMRDSIAWQHMEPVFCRCGAVRPDESGAVAVEWIPQGGGAWPGCPRCHKPLAPPFDAGPLAWNYGSGFPKSLDVSKAIDKAAGAEREIVGRKSDPRYQHAFNGAAASPMGNVDPRRERDDHGNLTAPATDAAKQWDGWGTALKPAFEPVVVARKPLAGKTVAANVQEFGTGALNIDGCRIETTDNLNGGAYSGSIRQRDEYSSSDAVPGAVALSRLNRGVGEYEQPAGRWPANVVLDESTAELVDRQSGVTVSRASTGRQTPKQGTAALGNFAGTDNAAGHDDSGGASRFFYTAKARKGERPQVDGTGHPTVKPLSLMQWLVRLVTPPGGVVLDPFLGSGTTAEACIVEGFRCVGIERDEAYLKLITARLSKPIAPVLFGMGDAS